MCRGINLVKVSSLSQEPSRLHQLADMSLGTKLVYVMLNHVIFRVSVEEKPISEDALRHSSTYP